MLADSLTTAELARRLSNLIRPGRVEQADYATARVRVRIGDIVTAWLPWLTDRAGKDRTWWAPEVGEQVIVLAPDGEPAQGWVLPAGFSDSGPAPADRPDVHRTVYEDGAVIEYDRAAHRLTATIPGNVMLSAEGTMTAEVGGEVTLTAGGNVTVTAPKLVVTADVEITGQVTVTGDFAQSGNLRVTGNVNATGHMLAGGPTSPNHRH